MVRVLANSPAATNAFFSFNAAMAASPMTADLGKRIAIAVAQANDCRTCLAAHTAFGRAKGVPDHELANESSVIAGLSRVDRSSAASLSSRRRPLLQLFSKLLDAIGLDQDVVHADTKKRGNL
jgi:AhpD family alkylhydroperoxidase